MLRGWLFAFSPARSSQGLAWRMSHPLGTGNGTPIAPGGENLKGRRGLRCDLGLLKPDSRGKGALKQRDAGCAGCSEPCTGRALPQSFPTDGWEIPTGVRTGVGAWMCSWGLPCAWGGCPGLWETLTCVVPRAVMLPVCTARCVAVTPVARVYGCGATICVLTPSRDVWARVLQPRLRCHPLSCAHTEGNVAGGAGRLHGFTP